MESEVGAVEGRTDLEIAVDLICPASIMLAVFIRNDYVNQILIVLLATCSGLNIGYSALRWRGIRTGGNLVDGYDPNKMEFNDPERDQKKLGMPYVFEPVGRFCPYAEGFEELGYKCLWDFGDLNLTVLMLVATLACLYDHANRRTMSEEAVALRRGFTGSLKDAQSSVEADKIAILGEVEATGSMQDVDEAVETILASGAFSHDLKATFHRTGNLRNVNLLQWSAASFWFGFAWLGGGFTTIARKEPWEPCACELGTMANNMSSLWIPGQDNTTLYTCPTDKDGTVVTTCLCNGRVRYGYNNQVWESLWEGEDSIACSSSTFGAKNDPNKTRTKVCICELDETAPEVYAGFIIFILAFVWVLLVLRSRRDKTAYMIGTLRAFFVAVLSFSYNRGLTVALSNGDDTITPWILLVSAVIAVASAALGPAQLAALPTGPCWIRAFMGSPDAYCVGEDDDIRTQSELQKPPETKEAPKYIEMSENVPAPSQTARGADPLLC